MYNERKITEDLYWIGGSDRRLSLFENVYPVPDGVSYNSYILLDEKTALFDTVDSSVEGLFFENLAHALNGRALDYIVVQHMEPDHSATLNEALRRYPEAKVVTNAKTLKMIGQFFPVDIKERTQLVKEGDTLSTGKHTFTFVMAPMVHWPEVMVSYDTTDKILFSADAFGTFGALNGNIFADEVSFETKCLDEARRYYTNIVGKYGPQVQALLKKAATLDIRMICPLHGPIWRENIGWFVDKYQKWSSYTPEEDAVLIAYGSIYGGTQQAVEILAGKLAERGVKNIAMYDVAMTHPSYLVSEAFRCSHIVLASATYNAGTFQPMEPLMADLTAHNLQARKVAIIANGSWAPMSGKLITEQVSAWKNTEILEPTVTLLSRLKEDQLSALDDLAEAITASLGISTAAAKKRHVCTTCGYIFEGEALPEGSVCPLCKHPTLR